MTLNTLAEPPPQLEAPFWDHTTALDRVSDADRAPLTKAQKHAAEAAERAEEVRQQLIARQTQIETLTSNRQRLAGRLARLEARDPAAQRAKCIAIMERLLDSDETAMDPARASEVNSAVIALAWIPELEKLLPGLIEKVKAELATLNADLAAVQASK